jgi:hypothetical protein
MLTSPTDNPVLVTLRSQYQGTLDALLIAAEWAAHPHPLQTCSESVSQTLCFLSNENILAVLSSMDGKMLMLFSDYDGKVIQWVAPYSQKIIGLSDSTMWNFVAGTASDPSLVEGAFIETIHPDINYQVGWVENKIIFSSQDGEKKKSYQLKEDQLIVTIETNTSSSYSLPVFGKIEQNDENIMITEDTARVDPSKLGIDFVNSAITVNSFLDSIDLLKEPENPSLAYPAGHYLPVPFSLIILENIGSFSAVFDFSASQ